ncbi:hypothetical protein [Azospirillum picis]|uniref:Minor tail protein n=1 Tax=Azospirillum picis TaxID=488438 RepID=A0ABU0MPK9_9PROT|nr:hypothetical protein [Azospirillum picis]MBP2301574.1 hypothetical protein [Azospirillum picis]MDQ0535406.1 hypothetical protein [Azospirillum picis]
MPSIPLISIRANALTESGLFKGTHALDCPLWRDGRNVIFKDGGPEKLAGWVSVVDSGATGVIRGADALQDEAGISRVFFGDQTKLYAWNGATVTELGTGYTGYEDETSTHPATAWSFERFGNWELATNGRDAPQIWKATGSFAPLAGVNFSTAEIFVRRGPHILAFNLTGWDAGNGKSTFAWCDADNPETWETTDTNSAGDLPIRDMDGEIKAAVTWGESIAVFGKADMYVVSYTGAPYYFGVQPALRGIGAVGKTSVVEVNRILYGFGQAGVWKTDGVTYEYLDTPALRSWIAESLDTTQLSKVCATYDASTEAVKWSLPTIGTGEPTVTISFRIPNASWSIEDYGRSAWVPRLGAFRYPIGISAGKLWTHNVGVDAGAGVAMVAYVQTRPFAADDARAWSYIDTLSLQLRRLAGTVKVRLGGQNNLDDTPSWSDWLTVDDGFEPIRLRKSGRFLTLEVRSDTVGADWALSGFDLYGSRGGRI